LITAGISVCCSSIALSKCSALAAAATRTPASLYLLWGQMLWPPCGGAGSRRGPFRVLFVKLLRGASQGAAPATFLAPRIVFQRHTNATSQVFVLLGVAVQAPAWWGRECASRGRRIPDGSERWTVAQSAISCSRGCRGGLH
jgi:hypothetical protein